MLGANKPAQRQIDYPPGHQWIKNVHTDSTVSKKC